MANFEALSGDNDRLTLLKACALIEEQIAKRDSDLLYWHGIADDHRRSRDRRRTAGQSDFTIKPILDAITHAENNFARAQSDLKVLGWILERLSD